ncbi:MAG: CPBP family intramembrane glutamic endopeptidase [Candidatus Hodarchaeota archaeon]
MNPSKLSDIQKPWQKRTWVQMLAIAIGILPIYITTIVYHVQSDQPLTMRNVLQYSIGVGIVSIIVILLLLRYLCGERIRDLNLKEGHGWKDILVGIGISVLTLVVQFLFSNPISKLFPRKPDSGLGTVFNEMVQNPWLFAMFVGPSLLIGAGIFEELTRVFLLSRLWNMWTNNVWRWVGIVISAVLFGLAHIYQGPGGIVMTGIFGMIMAVYYHYFGRVAPMMIAHYLNDAFQIAMIYIMANTA